jgi:thiol:disulfide interchange protein DsbA
VHHSRKDCHESARFLDPAGRRPGLALAGARPAQAQAPVEGTHYIRLSQPRPGLLPPAGKIEVVEFFWYECPHCNAFEPLLEPWARKLPADVAFRRVPVGFTARHQVAQKLYYALEEMGAGQTSHRKVFNGHPRPGPAHHHRSRCRGRGHRRRRRHGAKFSRDLQVLRGEHQGPTGAATVRGLQASTACPALGIQGRYITSAAMAGGNERVFQVVAPPGRPGTQDAGLSGFGYTAGRRQRQAPA